VGGCPFFPLVSGRGERECLWGGAFFEWRALVCVCVNRRAVCPVSGLSHTRRGAAGVMKERERESKGEVGRPTRSLAIRARYSLSRHPLSSTMLRTSFTRSGRALRIASAPSRGFAAAAAQDGGGGGGGVGAVLALGALAAAGYYIYANDLLDDIIVRRVIDGGRDRAQGEGLPPILGRGQGEARAGGGAEAQRCMHRRRKNTRAHNSHTPRALSFPHTVQSRATRRPTRWRRPCRTPTRRYNKKGGRNFSRRLEREREQRACAGVVGRGARARMTLPPSPSQGG